MTRRLYIDPGFQCIAAVVCDDQDGPLRWFVRPIDRKMYKAVSKASGVSQADLWHIAGTGCFIAAIVRADPLIREIWLEIPGGSQSSRAAKTLGLVAGCIVSYAATAGIPWLGMSPQAMKKGVLGKAGEPGKRSKSNLKVLIKKKVQEIWPAFTPETKYDEHVYDAAGLALAARRALWTP